MLFSERNVKRMLRVLDLFSGVGGQALALENSGACRTVAYCEKDPHARRVLQDNIERRRLDAGPVFHDVRELSAAALRRAGVKHVDLISGGFPCVDLSPVGLRRGLLHGDHSVLVLEVLRLARELRPSYLFLENVPAITKDADYPRVLRRLSKLGFDSHWTFTHATEVGARHLRKRWFLLAVRRDAPKRLAPSEPATLRLLLRQRVPMLAPRDHGTAKLQSRFMGNAVVPAVALRSFVALCAAAKDPGPEVSSESWRRSQAASFVQGRFRQRSRAEAADTKCPGTYSVTPPELSARSANRSPALTNSFLAACAPTPRTGANSMLPGRSMTRRTQRDLGNFFLSTAEFLQAIWAGRKRGETLEDARARFMVHPRHIAVFMGFPADWTERHLKRERALRTKKDIDGEDSP